MDEIIGTVIDRRYRVDRKIGEGGMGAVFQGEHVTVGNKVAIKVLHPDYSSDEEVVRRLAQEARVAGTLGHKNIVQVFDFSQMADGTHFLVMEYLEGETLADYLAREVPVPPRFIIPVALQVLDALAAAHARGIVHRDLKPENIFLTSTSDPNAHVKVLDFGISKIRTGTDDLHLTKTGTVLGTPYYMSPEQATGKKDLDFRTDIYALGVILYVSLTAQYPFDGETYNELIINIFSREPPPPRSIRPEIPEAVEAVVLKAMAKSRDARYEDAEAFAEALDGLIDDPALAPLFGGLTRSALIRSAQRTARASAPPPPPGSGIRRVGAASGDTAAVVAAPISRAGRSRAGLWIGLGAVAVAAVVAAFLAFGRGGSSAPPPAAVAVADAGTAVPVEPAAVAEAGADAALVVEIPVPEDVAPSPEAVVADAAAAVPTAASDVVTVKVSVDPADAQISVQGVVVAENPYEGRFRRGDPDIRIEVTAPGHEPAARFVRLDDDQSLEIRLDRSRTGTTVRRDAGAVRDTASTPEPPPPPPADAGAPPPRDTGPAAPPIDTDNPFANRGP
jgi:serine/threonine-protein kinase